MCDLRARVVTAVRDETQHTHTHTPEAPSRNSKPTTQQIHSHQATRTHMMLISFTVPRPHAWFYFAHLARFLSILLAGKTCTTPDDTTGYNNLSVRSSDLLTFDVRVTCHAQEGYGGTAVATRCMDAGPYTLSGCIGLTHIDMY